MAVDTNANLMGIGQVPSGGQFIAVYIRWALAMAL
jgi:hypothetical protein